MKPPSRFAVRSCAIGLLVSGSMQLGSPDAASRSPTTATAAPEGEKRTVLDIEGMVCGGCAMSIEAVLSKLAGVKSVSVDWEKGQAVIVAEASVTEEALAQAVERSGYRVAGRATPATRESSPGGAAEVAVLDGTLLPFVEQFNQDAGKPRVLALLSPT